MNLKQQYAALAAILMGETVVFVLLSSVALWQPAAGGLGFLVAAAVVYYYSARHPTPFGIIASLFNTVVLSYFSQCRGLPTALLFLLVCGASPYIEQLSRGLARTVFAAAYAVTTLILAALVSGSMAPTARIVLCYALIAVLCGLAGARYLVRPSPLEPNNG
jgi:hypothetical protein